MARTAAAKKPAGKPAAKTKAPAKAKPATRKIIAKPKASVGSGNGAVAKQLAKSIKAPAKPMPEHKEKIKKAKLVRDSFTMPEAEYQVLGDVKKACLKAGVAVKKSELLRVGVALIQRLDLSKLKDVLSGLPPLKAGRPKSDK